MSFVILFCWNKERKERKVCLNISFRWSRLIRKLSNIFCQIQSRLDVTVDGIMWARKNMLCLFAMPLESIRESLPNYLQKQEGFWANIWNIFHYIWNVLALFWNNCANIWNSNTNIWNICHSIWNISFCFEIIWSIFKILVRIFEIFVKIFEIFCIVLK